MERAAQPHKREAKDVHDDLERARLATGTSRKTARKAAGKVAGKAAGAGASAKAGKSKPSRAVKPEYDKKVIALVYDFDGTLSPRPMQEYAFLPSIGVDAKAFWEEANQVARREGADPLITYMHLIYKKAKAAGVRIDREDLVAQGRDVELFPGVEDWFDAIGEYTRIRSESQV